MSPADFARFRELEFDQSAIPVAELNPHSGWVVYIAAKDQGGNAVASSTIAFGHSDQPPDDQDAYALALTAAPEIVDYCVHEGYLLPKEPSFVRVPLPSEYRAA
jgi:hypothetical protein